VLIKESDDSQRDLEALQALLKRPALPTAKRRLIEREIRFVEAGLQGEREAAYQINAYYEKSKRCAVIHDLRIEVDGRVAQIDHLLMTRVLHVWVCESKHFAQGVKINEHGEWARLWQGKPVGMESPIEQNRLHIEVLKDAFRQGLVPLPKRLGIALQPTIESFVLISSKAQIHRPARAKVDGLDCVIKVDQLKSTIDRAIETESAPRAVAEVRKYVSERTLEELGWQIAALHRPRQIDWAARFGLDAEPSVGPPARTSVRCAACERPVTQGEIDYCQDHRQQFAGRILCYACQHK